MLHTYVSPSIKPVNLNLHFTYSIEDIGAIYMRQLVIF